MDIIYAAASRYSTKAFDISKKLAPKNSKSEGFSAS